MKLETLLVILLATIINTLSWGQSGTIANFCGNGYPHDTGNNVAATAASIPANTVSGVFDSHGNFYFSERRDAKVRKITTAGVILNYAGTGITGFSGDGGPATNAKLNDPYGLAVDKNDNIYIAEVTGGKIRRIDAASGLISTIAGNGSFSDAGDGGPATAALIGYPLDLVFAKNGDLLISTGLHKVRKISISTGLIQTIAGDTSSYGSPGYSGDGGPATAAKLNAPQGMCIDSLGNIYLAEMGHARIRKIDGSSGIITTFAGIGTCCGSPGDGGLATAAQISPIDVTVDPNGFIYIADHYGNRIRMVDGSGIIHTIGGTGTYGFSGDGGPATAAMIKRPDAIALDGCGNIYFPDQDNYRIRKITASTTVVPTVTITANTGNRLCYGMPVTFTATNTYGGTAPAYQWQVNGVNVGTGGASYTYAPTNGDSVQCVLTSNLYCIINPMANSNVLHMVVDTLSPPVVTLTGPAVALPGTLVNVSAAISGISGAYRLHWYNHGVAFSTTTTPMASYTKAAGVDTITTVITSLSRLCYDSTASGYHLVNDHNLGTSPQPSPKEREVTCWPNPAGDVLHVAAIVPITTISVFDLLGRQCMSAATINGKAATLNISQLTPGIYVVKLNNNFARFVKQ